MTASATATREEVGAAERPGEVRKRTGGDGDDERAGRDPQRPALADRDRESVKPLLPVADHVLDVFDHLAGERREAREQREHDDRPGRPTAAPPNRNVDPTRYETRALPSPGVPLKIVV